MDDGRYHGDLNLSGMDEYLGSPEQIRATVERVHAEVEVYEAKYGKDGLRRYLIDCGDILDFDLDMQHVNAFLWYGVPVVGDRAFKARADERMHEIYGDRYDELKRHEWQDMEVAEMLIADAMKTGKWKELPDELQPLYHERIGDGNGK